MGHAGGAERIKPKGVLCFIKYLSYPIPEPLELFVIELCFKDRQLHPRAEVFEQLGKLEPPGVIFNIIANGIEHALRQ